MIIEGIPEFNEGDEIPPEVIRGHYRLIRKPPKLDIISLRIINDDGTYQELQPDSEFNKPKVIEKPQEKWSWADDWDREEFLAFSSSQSSPKSPDKPQLKHSEKDSVAGTPSDRYLPSASPKGEKK